MRVEGRRWRPAALPLAPHRQPSSLHGASSGPPSRGRRCQRLPGSPSPASVVETARREHGRGSVSDQCSRQRPGQLASLEFRHAACAAAAGSPGGARPAGSAGPPGCGAPRAAGRRPGAAQRHPHAATRAGAQAAGSQVRQAGSGGAKPSTAAAAAAAAGRRCVHPAAVALPCYPHPRTCCCLQGCVLRHVPLPAWQQRAAGPPLGGDCGDAPRRAHHCVCHPGEPLPLVRARAAHAGRRAAALVQQLPAPLHCHLCWTPPPCASRHAGLPGSCPPPAARLTRCTAPWCPLSHRWRLTLGPAPSRPKSC